MITVHLHGHLAEKFEGSYQFLASSPGEVLRALMAQVKDFTKTIGEGNYRITQGNEVIDETLFNFRFGQYCNEMHIIPMLEGSGNDGLGKIIAGTLLIATAIAIPGGVFGGGPGFFGAGSTAGAIGAGELAALGGAIALGGVSQMLSPTPRLGNVFDRESAEERPSHLLGGLSNLIEQGPVVPVPYGTVRAGARPISAGLSTESVDLDIIFELEDDPVAIFTLTVEQYTNDSVGGIPNPDPNMVFTGFSLVSDFTGTLTSDLDKCVLLDEEVNIGTPLIPNIVDRVISFGKIDAQSGILPKSIWQLFEYDADHTDPDVKRLRLSLHPAQVLKDEISKIRILNGVTEIFEGFTSLSNDFKSPHRGTNSNGRLHPASHVGAAWEWDLVSSILVAHVGSELNVEITY